MKKTFKRLGAALLAMAMAVSVLCTGALAEETMYTISVAADDTHTYSVYQIFTGTLATDKKTLSDVKWGKNGINNGTEITEGDAVPKEVLDDLASVNADDKTNTEKLNVIKKYVKLTSDAFGSVSKDQPLTNVPAGYYLIKDSAAVTGNDAATNYIVSVVNDVTITRKTGVPEVDKTVNGKPADTANIGDEVEFKLFATLPNNYEDYSSYKLVFNDTLSAGLTLTDEQLNALTVKVYESKDAATADTTNKQGTELKKLGTDAATGDKTGYRVEKDKDNEQKFTVSFEDLMQAKTTAEGIPTIKNGYCIVVTYKATLNENAVLGGTGNLNTVNLTYSNDPNNTSDGTTTDKNVPVYTFQMDVIKGDKDSFNNGTFTKKLEGAEFILTREVATGEDDKTKTQYAVVENNKLKSWSDSKESATTLKTDKDGKISVAGLKNGTYYLEETKAPDGYNLLTDKVTVVINNDTTNVGTLTGVTSTSGVKDDTTAAANGTINATKGTATINIANAAGSQLPSTGGMGTTLFYIIGGVLMAGAAVVLVIKKKRSSAE